MSTAKLEPPAITTLLAIENASGLCDEVEPLELCFERLKGLSLEGNSPLYIGLTWNEENRFGGGASAQAVGLKQDGKALLDFMHQKGIALDFSHASDRLVTESLSYIDRRNLDISVMASHSNFRSVQPAARNLPDELALEIARRGGVIGINFYMAFVGEEREGSRAFLKHLEQAIHLGIASNLSFGADFFYEGDLSPPASGVRSPFGFEGYTEASCYPKLIQEWRASGLFTDVELEGICWGHVERFLQQIVKMEIVACKK